MVYNRLMVVVFVVIGTWYLKVFSLIILFDYKWFSISLNFLPMPIHSAFYINVWSLETTCFVWMNITVTQKPFYDVGYRDEVAHCHGATYFNLKMCNAILNRSFLVSMGGVFLGSQCVECEYCDLYRSHYHTIIIIQSSHTRVHISYSENKGTHVQWY